VPKHRCAAGVAPRYLLLPGWLPGTQILYAPHGWPSIPAAFPLLQAHSWIGKHFPGKALTVRGFREPEKSAAGVVEALIVRSVVTRVR
jgi:hypothetical protein